jgi:glycosyltransferase involved in cell wall biosynthesis
MTKGRRVLLVSYFFPPVGGAGVQRAAKFAKYLPQFGWDVSVLTVSNPSVPLLDGSLPADVPESTLIRKARTWEPSYAVKNAVSAARSSGSGSVRGFAKSAARTIANAVLQPDPQVLWAPAAIRAGRALLREVPHDAVLATAPPFSSFLVGRSLARAASLPLVLDYRDEWDISNAVWENKTLGTLPRFLQRKMQASALHAASAVVATTKMSARALEDLCRAADSNAAVETIYNGYDPDDFDAAPLEEGYRAAAYRLAYVGTLWNLTSVEPLVRAVEILAGARPDLASKLELVFAGRKTGPQEQWLARLAASPVRVVFKPYVNHADAVALMKGSDGLCVLLSDLPKAERVVPAKLFEYIAARRWILAVAPRGEVWDLLAGHPAAACVAPRDVQGIVAVLVQELERFRAKRGRDLSTAPSAGFDRRSQAETLAALLNRCSKNAAPADPAVHDELPDEQPVHAGSLEEIAT